MGLPNFGNQEDTIFNFKQSSSSSQGVGSQNRVTTATLIVATDDSGDFMTIQEAINSLETGRDGYIQVKEGTYNLKATIIVPSNITIKGAGARTVITAPQEITPFMSITGDNVTIEGIKFMGTV